MPPDSLAATVGRLTAAGFVADLAVVDGSVRDLGAVVDHDPDHLRAVELHRFEGSSDPDDEALVVAVATDAGEPLGTLVMPFGPSASAAEADVLRRIHRAAIHDAPPPPFAVDEHIAAVFDSTEAAESAVAALRALGVDDSHLGVAVRGGAAMAFERDEEADLARTTWHGVAAGAAVGALGGVALVGLLVPGLGALGVGGLAAAGAAGGFGGGMLGAYLGVGARTPETEAHARIGRVQLEPGQVLLVVRAHHVRAEVEGVLARAGGRLVPVAGPPGGLAAGPNPGD